MKPIVFEDLRPYLLKLNVDAQHRLLDAFKLADLGESNEVSIYSSFNINSS